MNSYYALHNHTEESNQRLIDCIVKVEDLIQGAFDLGLNGVAITDHETVTASVRALNYVKNKREKDERWNDFKLILGNEIYLCRNDLNSTNYDGKKDRFYHFILLAKDEIGHRQIRELSSRAYEHSFMKNKMRRVPTYYRDIEEIIGENPGHIIGSTACLGSYIGSTLLKISAIEEYPEVFETELAKIKKWLTQLENIFGKGNFFLELQPSDNDEQIYVNNWLIKLSNELNIPAIITTDTHYLRPEDREIHKAYLNSKDGDREVDAFYATTYLMTSEEIHNFMDAFLTKEVVNQCLENTKLIGSQITEYQLSKPYKLPYLPSEADKILANKPFDIPEYPLSEIWYTFMKSEEASDRVMIHRLFKKMNSNPSFFYTKERVERATVELETVWKASKKQNLVWSKYFLQVADYIDIAWTEGDTIVGCGRGSGVGFYLNYLLDVTQVDPIREKVKTYFWRYLNPERVSILDTDTDVQSNRRNKVIEALQNRYGEKRVIRVLTERTEGSKAAILTAARGLGIDVDDAQYIASLIESDRGIQRSLKDTYYGNEEKDFVPNRTFQDEMKKFPKLWEVAQKIEGLICGSGSHAGGVVIVDEDFTETGSLMKLNSGEWVTCFDLHEAEETSNVKIDLLATLNLTRIRTCLDLLVRYGLVKKYPTLKETYENCIGIYNLEREAPKMWEMVADNKIVSLFQFETDVGQQGTALAAPQNVEDLCALNSIIRLMATEKGGELPVEKFARFKKNHELWEAEMRNYHLTEDEKNIIRKHLTTSHGICECQESLMSLIQEPEIAGWDLKQADYLRKSIAKKDKKLYEKITEEFFANAKEKNLSPTITNYFWNVCVKTQAGYSFCAAHTLAYSLIGLQNINLAFKYPIIFWNTANLIVDSSGVDNGEEDEEEEIEEVEDEVEETEEDDDDEEEEVVKEKVKRAKKTVNYGKTASAIGKFQSRGIKISPPDINKSDFSFTPLLEENSIVYGLRGITRVSADLTRLIIANRPYSSFDDFNKRIKTNKLQMINLIKSGCFDSFGNREEIMRKYITSIAGVKTRLTLQNMQGLIDYEVLPEEVSFYAELFCFNKFLKKHKFGIYYALNDSAINFISENFDPDMIFEGVKIYQKTWDNAYKKAMEPMRVYLKENLVELLNSYNYKLVQEQYEKYASGSLSKWEMDSISCYYHEHELENVNEKYGFVNFFELPEEPEVERVFRAKNGADVKIYRTCLIAGTVLDKKKLKNSITILTKDGVVNVKIYKNQYSLFDKQISEKDSSGKKKVLEKSWFTKGNLLMIQGIRRGNDFVPKKSKTSAYPIISKINEINDDGFLTLQFEREGGEEE